MAKQKKHSATHVPAGGLALSQDTVTAIVQLVTEARGAGQSMADGIAVVVVLGDRPIDALLMFEADASPETRRRIADAVAGRTVAASWMPGTLVERAISRMNLDESAVAFARTPPPAGRFRYALFRDKGGTAFGTWGLPD